MTNANEGIRGKGNSEQGKSSFTSTRMKQGPSNK